MHLWPVYLLVIVYSTSYYNVDYFLIPTLIKLKFTRMQILLIAGPVGFIEILCGYIGWSYFRDLVEKWLKDDIDFMKKVMGDLEARGYLEWVKIYFSRKYLKFMNGNGNGHPKKSTKNVYILFDRFSDKMIKRVLKILKGGSYFLVFMIGLIPIPGPRMISDIFCGTARWKKGFIIVAIGNFLKTFGFVFGWSWFFS